jgi:hypothetical protein
MTNLKTEAKELASEIRAFDRQCLEEEYTDTDTAWILLNKARRLLSKIGKEGR